MQEETRQALDGHLKRFLRPVFWCLAGIYSGISLLWGIGVRADVPPTVAGFWVLTAALSALGALVVGRPRLPAKWAHPALLVIVMSAVNNVLWLIGLTRDFIYTPVLYLILLGTAVLFLSIPYFLVAVAIAITGWTVEAVLIGNQDVSVKWGFTLFAAIVIAVLAQVMRVRTYTRLEELRRQEARRIREESDLQRARHEAADRSLLLNLTAHEIATPLTPMFLRLRTLRDEMHEASPRAKAALDGLERSLHRLHASMQDVVEAVGPPRPAAPNPTVDLRMLIAHCAVEAQKLTRVPLLSDVQADGPVQVDAVAVGQIIRRLVQDADLRVPDQGAIRVTARRGAGAVEIVVEDDGPPIAPERAAVLFEPLRHSYDPMTHHSSGLGLGLHLASLEAKRLGGSLEYEALPVGSRFVLRIPDPLG